MNNAHLRFGRLFYEFKGETRRTAFSVLVDRLVADTRDPGMGHRGHLVSVFGSDAEIGAIAAAISKSVVFSVRARGTEPMRMYLDQHSQCYRGSIVVPGRNRPLRHLIAISQQWLTSVTEANPEPFCGGKASSLAATPCPSQLRNLSRSPLTSTGSQPIPTRGIKAPASCSFW